MTPAPALLACDWGTTNLRAWTLDAAGRVLRDREFPLGVSRLPAGEAAAIFHDEVRPAMAAVSAPAILCGMIGSDLGWTTAPYAACPADGKDLAAALVSPRDAADVRIVPGLRYIADDGRIDVMRGEETQLFGWLAQHPESARGRRLVCHPGTHAKWMCVQDGRLTAFITAMTGELFAVLSRHSVLRTEGSAEDLDAFDAGVAAAGDGGALAARLFTVRSRVVGGSADPASTTSYLSGLLIGADIAGSPALLGAQVSEGVTLLGDAGLCSLYQRALAYRGVEADAFDGEAAAVAGLLALHQSGAPA